MALMVVLPAHSAPRYRRSPKMISNREGLTGCVRTRIGCATSWALMLSASPESIRRSDVCADWSATLDESER
jgi:hypothetical protein